MGTISPKIRSVASALFNNIKSFYVILVLLSLINLSVCIYEDQIGKFDWRQSYVGRIKFAHFDTVSTAKKLIVATEENVIAALNIKTGEILWRHVFEGASRGNIHLLHVGEKIVTVSGENPYVVRVWDSNLGNIISEWSLLAKNEELAKNSKWFIVKDTLYHVIPVYGVHVEVTAYQLNTGQIRGRTSKLPAAWSNSDCILANSHYTCISGDYGSQLLISLDLASNAVKLLTQPLSQYLEWTKTMSSLRNIDGLSNLPAFIIGNKVLWIENSDINSMELVGEEARVYAIQTPMGPAFLQTVADDEKISIVGKKLLDKSLVSELTLQIDVALDSPVLEAAVCTKNTKNQLICRVLMTGEDGTVILTQQNGQVIWTREESLANIVSVEFVDLPVSEIEAEIEKEFDQKEGGLFLQFNRRISTQWHQLSSFLQNLVAPDDASWNHETLVRDYFDLQKLIIVFTKFGKIFAINNLSGELLWSRFIDNCEPLSENSLYLRRSARHPPLEPLLTVVGKNKKTGHGILINLNPLTGELSSEEIIYLDYPIKQLTILHQTNAEFVKPLIIMDSDESVVVLPKNCESLVNDVFMFVADRQSTKVQGFAISYDGRSVIARKTWSLLLKGTNSEDHEIVHIIGKNPLERIHSQGKVMNDRSVLYKYINPNLVAFITYGSDPIHKDVLNTYLVDAVSGLIIFAQQHQRVTPRGTPIHSNNFLVYAYYNEKLRRTEIATIELYEGAERWLAPGAAFSSLAPQNALPIVDRQSYILPASVTAMKDTISEKGITDKHLLFGLTSGSLVEVPWSWLEVRKGDSGMEGVRNWTPSPEIPLPAEMTLSYNISMAPSRGIHVTPSGLESTCLVFSHGLDLFYTRAAPSKTFDLLKDDFDYFLISIVLVGLIVATYVTKCFANRKMLKQAWK